MLPKPFKRAKLIKLPIIGVNHTTTYEYLAFDMHRFREDELAKAEEVSDNVVIEALATKSRSGKRHLKPEEILSKLVVCAGFLHEPKVNHTDKSFQGYIVRMGVVEKETDKDIIRASLDSFGRMQESGEYCRIILAGESKLAKSKREQERKEASLIRETKSAEYKNSSFWRHTTQEEKLWFLHNSLCKSKLYTFENGVYTRTGSGVLEFGYNLMRVFKTIQPLLCVSRISNRTFIDTLNLLGCDRNLLKALNNFWLEEAMVYDYDNNYNVAPENRKLKSLKSSAILSDQQIDSIFSKPAKPFRYNREHLKPHIKQVSQDLGVPQKSLLDTFRGK